MRSPLPIYSRHAQVIPIRPALDDLHHRMPCSRCLTWLRPLRADIRIEPAWKVSIVYGMPCAIYHQLPAAYYLAARFRNDFESAVLHAVNGGGQNQARAILTGALVGAQVGLSGILQRFLDGLDDLSILKNLAIGLASQVSGFADTSN